jgi:hypothetical protein
VTVADRLRAIVSSLPEGAAVTLPGAALRAWLEDEPAVTALPVAVQADEPADWRARLWTCPDETRLGVRELAEALDRSADFVYRAVDPKRSAERGRDPLPCSRLDGVLVFTAGAIRRWLEASAVTVNAEPRHVRLHTKRGA